jgi:hypothetical protein
VDLQRGNGMKVSEMAGQVQRTMRAGSAAMDAANDYLLTSRLAEPAGVQGMNQRGSWDSRHAFCFGLSSMFRGPQHTE